VRLSVARPTRSDQGASERARGPLQPASRALAPRGMSAALLSLQRLAGNHATRQLIQRARTVAVDRRCPLAGPCPDDPLADHGGAASTTCYTNTGRMRTTNLVEHCAGDCVAQHEAVHHVDRGECCTRVKRCRDLAGGDTVKEAACNETFDAWYPRLSDWTECNAYRTEIACLKSLIDNRCDPSEGLKETAFDIVFGVSSGCCDELKGELAIATQREKSSCAAAVEAPCPFRSDGTR
jgi:hypothetical protein